MNKIDSIKLGGARKKNGHKMNCSCHICQNMINKAKRGGYTKEIKQELEKKRGGSKKPNGHRADCKCPICRNMANAKHHSRKMSLSGGRKGRRSTRKHKGGNEPDIENQLGDIEEGFTKGTETEAKDDEYDEIDFDSIPKYSPKDKDKDSNVDMDLDLERGKSGTTDTDDFDEDLEIGKTPKTDTDLEMDIDLENGSTETGAPELDDYDALNKAELGEAGENVVGGRRGRKTRKGGKHRRHRKKTKHFKKYDGRRSRKRCLPKNCAHF